VCARARRPVAESGPAQGDVWRQTGTAPDRGRVGEPVAGIASAAGAPKAQHAVIRVLRRLAVLAGLVIGGWLLGSATGWADEGAPEDRVGGAASLAEFPSPAPTATMSRIEARVDDLLPAAAPAPIPVQPPVLDTPVLDTPIMDTAVEPVGELALETVLQPVVDPVLPETIVPRTPPRIPVGNQSESGTPAEAPDSAEVPASGGHPPPTGPALPTEPAVWALSLPSPLLPAVALEQVVDAAADQLAGWSAGSAPPTPASPPGLAASCPAGSATASATTKGVHAVTLHDGYSGVDLKVGQPQRGLRTAGLPGAPEQRPSTSPD